MVIKYSGAIEEFSTARGSEWWVLVQQAQFLRKKKLLNTDKVLSTAIKFLYRVFIPPWHIRFDVGKTKSFSSWLGSYMPMLSGAKQYSLGPSLFEQPVYGA